MSPLIKRLRSFGAYTMDDDGHLTEFDPNPLTGAAADEIERLTNALHVACGVLSSSPGYSHMHPEQIVALVFAHVQDADRAGPPPPSAA